MHTALSFPFYRYSKRQMCGTKETQSFSTISRAPLWQSAWHKTLHLPSFSFSIHDDADADDGMAHYLGSVSCRRKYTNNNETYKNIILPHNWAYLVSNCLPLVSAYTVADVRYAVSAIPQSHTLWCLHVLSCTVRQRCRHRQPIYMSLMRFAKQEVFGERTIIAIFVFDVTGVRDTEVYFVFSSRRYFRYKSAYENMYN